MSILKIFFTVSIIVNVALALTIYEMNYFVSVFENSFYLSNKNSYKIGCLEQAGVGCELKSRQYLKLITPVRTKRQ